MFSSLKPVKSLYALHFILSFCRVFLYIHAMSKTTRENSEIIDKLGICASTLCLVHCIATALMIFGLPLLGQTFLSHELFHDIFAVVVVVTVVIAVYPHCNRHGHKDIVAFAVLGAALVLAGVIMHDAIKLPADILTMLGSVSLIFAHYRNIKVRHGKCAH